MTTMLEKLKHYFDTTSPEEIKKAWDKAGEEVKGVESQTIEEFLKYNNMNLKLCYVEGNFAYFTSKPLEEQWGDDWDDAPYEHNAETPYEEEGYTIYKLAFECDLKQPCEDHINSPYSVEDINKGKVAWLRSYSWREEQTAIFAGESVQSFIDKILKANGEIYLKL